MKTFILSVFALFLWLSADVCSAEIENDYWVNTNFPGSEVKFLIGGRDNVFAISADNHVYVHRRNPNLEWFWEKLEIEIEGDVKYAYKYDICTDKVWYTFFDPSWSVMQDTVFEDISHITFVQGNCASYIAYNKLHHIYNHKSYGNIPEGNKIFKTISADNYTVKYAGITNSGELFVSYDTCKTWEKPANYPQNHFFTDIHWSDTNEFFIVGSDSVLFILKDSLESVDVYDGGYVTCLISPDFDWHASTEQKGDKLQFFPFWYNSIIVGTKYNGVYDFLEDRLTKKSDSLEDMYITILSYNKSGPVYVKTKSNDIYMTTSIVGSSVEDLDLTPYALKISPNPAKSRATITFHNTEYAEIEIAIYDLFGRKAADVHSGHLAEGDYNFPVDLSGFAAGSYFLSFGVGGRAGSLNLIVE